MQRKKCSRALASALVIAAAALTLGGAARASTYKIIHQFGLAKKPLGNLTIDAAGNLYGTTFYGGDSTACTTALGGCGVVWKLAPNGRLTMLHQFTGPPDGAWPDAGLVFDAAGNLYGTTSAGGDPTVCPSSQSPGGCGVVFELKPNPAGTWTESVLHTFTGGADGAAPTAGLIFDAAGNLYGTTYFGGSNSTSCYFGGCGIAFKLAPKPDGTWTESVLYSFTGGGDGSNPSAGLVSDAAGNLYGTTWEGGNLTDCDGGSCGVVFKLTPNRDETWTESVLHSFSCGDGALAQGVVFDTAGNLYGTTFGSNTGCQETVYKLQPNPDGTWAESTLYRFIGGVGGFFPNGGLIFDAAGNLYGTTFFGGFEGETTTCAYSGCGVVFKLTPTSSGWKETVLWKFLGVGANPGAPVIFDKQGNLYGTTTSGTGNYGVVFKIKP